MLNRPFDQSNVDETNFPDVNIIIVGLIKIFGTKIHHLPSSHAIKVFKMLASHLDLHYMKPKNAEPLVLMRYYVSYRIKAIKQNNHTVRSADLRVFPENASGRQVPTRLSGYQRAHVVQLVPLRNVSEGGRRFATAAESLTGGRSHRTLHRHIPVDATLLPGRRELFEARTRLDDAPACTARDTEGPAK